MQTDSTSAPASQPRYQVIHEALRRKIISGEWPPGYKLPSEPELAHAFDCARMTVSRAIGELANRGLVVRRRRAGTTVNVPRMQETVLEIHDIEAEIVAAGHAYQFERFTLEIRGATASDAAALNVAVNARLLAVVGLHRADGRPHALEERLINLGAVPDATRQKFLQISPGRWLLARVPWTDAEHQISALNSDRIIAQRLEIAHKTACLCIERRTRLNKEPVTYVRLIYPCTQHRLIAHFERTG